MEDSFHGQIKWFDERRGYGFLRCDELSEDIFIHKRSIIQDGYLQILPGDAVTFRVKVTGKGTQAVDAVFSKAY